MTFSMDMKKQRKKTVWTHLPGLIKLILDLDFNRVDAHALHYGLVPLLQGLPRLRHLRLQVAHCASRHDGVAFDAFSLCEAITEELRYLHLDLSELRLSVRARSGRNILLVRQPDRSLARALDSLTRLTRLERLRLDIKGNEIGRAWSAKTCGLRTHFVEETLNRLSTTPSVFEVQVPTHSTCFFACVVNMAEMGLRGRCNYLPQSQHILTTRRRARKKIQHFFGTQG